jgi:hypothetical protein
VIKDTEGRRPEFQAAGNVVTTRRHTKKRRFVMRSKSWIAYLAAMVMSLALTLAGCGGNGHSIDGGGGVSNAGGTVNMSGVKMVIPAGAIDEELTVNPQITTEDAAPAPAPAGATIASKTVVISGLTYNFYEPALVTMPYDTTNLGTDDVPAVFFYDEGIPGYSLLSVKSIDTTAKTITFSTTHGGKYVAMGIKGLGADLGITGNVAAPKAVAKRVAAAVDSGFAPATDGFFHPNFGAYDSPGGSCLGMANFSVWYFNTTKASNSNTGLYTMYKEGDLTRWQDDVTARELISRAFMASSQTWAKSWMQKEYTLGPQLTGYMMILGLKISGPMTFLMADQWPGMQSGHAAVVYKYDANKFYIYDDNFPGEVVTIDWAVDAGTGKYKFSNYTKNAAYNPQFTQFSFEGFATLAEYSQYKQLYDGANLGWSAGSSKFNTLTVTSAADSKNNALTIGSDGTIELLDADSITIQGTVTGGIKTAKYIIYRLNGGQRYRVNVAGGAFTIPNLAISQGTNTLMMVATDDKFNEWNAYAGFKEVPIKIKGSLFFQNAGFETGDFSSWYSERHLWADQTPEIKVPSDKSAIVGVGMDPYYKTLNMVYVGKYAARVNNYDNMYHISSVSQTATVPNAANPQAKFYWAAVLEDPQHPAAEQPYVDVTVTDDTTSKVLYYKHFYSNDPSYSGWVNTGSSDWLAIPWQTITLGFSKAEVGHKITVKVEAADCDQGGHGGYVYLDGDE